MARLIDADALMDVIRKHEYCLATKQGSIDYGMFTLGIQQAVDEQPTVIENPLSGKLRGVTYEDGKIIDVHIRDTDDVVKVFVPVRHGRWIDKGEYAVCMECGGRSGTQYDGVEPIPLMPQFCPNCGAKMDGGTD